MPAFNLPFGWKLTRAPTENPIPTLSLNPAQNATRTYRNAGKHPSSERPAAPPPSQNFPSRRFNALSGAPDRLASGATGNYRGMAGRVSVNDPEAFDGSGVWRAVSRRKLAGRAGLAHSFDIKDFEHLDPDALADMMADLSPEVSKALWDFVNLGNSGYEYRAYTPGTQEINDKGQAALDQIFNKLAEYHGTAGVWLDKRFLTIFLRGSVLMELVLAKNGRDFVDIAAPDTKTLEFRRSNHPERGQVWKFGQRINGEFVNLDIPTIRYIPVHPLPDSIEGRPLCSSSFFLAIFLMALLRDVKRVIQHQGYLRLDITVKISELMQTIPAETQNNPEALADKIAEIVTDIQNSYANLEPDDTYIHSDSVEVNSPVGTVSADSIQGVDAMLKALERMAVRALKTMPVLMGTDQSRSETQANREWEIYAKGITTCQHWLESGLEYLLATALRAQGIQAAVEFRFATFRDAERVRDAQVDILQTKLARYQYDCGYISQDEAAQIATGKDAADMPEPRDAAQEQDFGTLTEDNPNPGEARSSNGNGNGLIYPNGTPKILFTSSRQPTVPDLDAAEDFVDSYGTEALENFLEAEVATDEEQEKIDVEEIING